MASRQTYPSNEPPLHDRAVGGGSAVGVEIRSAEGIVVEASSDVFALTSLRPLDWGELENAVIGRSHFRGNTATRRTRHAWNSLDMVQCAG
jgi:hypothetical protein